MAQSSPRLGRGLASLISPDIVQSGMTANAGRQIDTATGRADDRSSDVSSPHPASLAHAKSLPEVSVGPGAVAGTRLIPLDRIRANPHQPRRAFDDAAIQSLAASLRDRGTLQPIVVRPAEGGYELVAGERRLRAAKVAGLASIPAIIRHVSDNELLELALIENVQRADLNPLEKARAYRALHQQYALSHDEIAWRMGEDRATVTNTVRLLDLAEEALALLAAGDLGAGHGKALLGIIDKHLQSEIARRAAREGWSVRKLESVVRSHREGGSPAASAGNAVRPAVRNLEQLVSEALGVRVTIREGRKKHTGAIAIEYYSLDDFERIMERLGVGREVVE